MQDRSSVHSSEITDTSGIKKRLHHPSQSSSSPLNNRHEYRSARASENGSNHDQNSSTETSSFSSDFHIEENDEEIRIPMVTVNQNKCVYQINRFFSNQFNIGFCGLFSGAIGAFLMYSFLSAVQQNLEKDHKMEDGFLYAFCGLSFIIGAGIGAVVNLKPSPPASNDEFSASDSENFRPG